MTILQRCLVHLCEVQFTTALEHTLSIVQLPWQLVPSVAVIPLTLLTHYRGLNKDSDSAKPEFVYPNQFFKSIPVSRRWLPRVGDIVAVQTQDSSVYFG